MSPARLLRSLFLRRGGYAAAGALLAAASPAAAEPITAYWRLVPLADSGAVSAGFDAPFFQQRMVPVRLVRLSVPALAAGGKTPVAAGTFLYEVVNRSGRKGYCTLKDRSAGNQAKSLFIPALDQRPCFVDADGDGRFEASFAVFEAYTRLSPPQPRGSIDAARPMAESAAYAEADPAEFPAPMTISYRLIAGETLAKTRLRVAVDRPGRSEYVDLRGTPVDGGHALTALGTLVIVKSIDGARAELEVRVPPDAYVYAEDDGTVALPNLPEIGVR